MAFERGGITEEMEDAIPASLIGDAMDLELKHTAIGKQEFARDDPRNAQH